MTLLNHGKLKGCRASSRTLNTLLSVQLVAYMLTITEQYIGLDLSGVVLLAMYLLVGAFMFLGIVDVAILLKLLLDESKDTRPKLNTSFVLFLLYIVALATYNLVLPWVNTHSLYNN